MKAERTIYRFSIPGIPPSVNHCYVNRWNGRGKVYNRQAEDYFDEMALAAAQLPEIAGNVKVEYALYFPNRIVRDPGNFEKVLSDGLQRAGVLANDKQIRDVRAYDAGIDRENPRVEVMIMATEDTR